MDQAVQNGVSDRGIGDDLVPLVDGKLAGHEGGSLAVAVVEDLQQIAIRFAGDARNTLIIDDQQGGTRQLLEQGQEAAIRLGGLQRPQPVETASA
jgi:hypothetical protein